MFWKSLIQSHVFYDSGIFTRCHISLMNVMKYWQTKCTPLNSRRLRCYIRHCGTGGKLKKLGVCKLCMSTCHNVHVRSYHWILLSNVIKKRLFTYILTLEIMYESFCRFTEIREKMVFGKERVVKIFRRIPELYSPM